MGAMLMFVFKKLMEALMRAFCVCWPVYRDEIGDGGACRSTMFYLCVCNVPRQCCELYVFCYNWQVNCGHLYKNINTKYIYDTSYNLILV
jgi:hypothetical protein